MRLETDVLGVRFQNPVLLAAGTCGFGMELQDVIDLEALGGFVTKSVTMEPRTGNPAPRVTEFGGGMLNSIGLANPGLEGTKRDKLPWIRDNIRRAQVLVSIAGHTTEEYFRLIEGLDGEDGFLGFEVVLSERREEGRRPLRARSRGCFGNPQRMSAPHGAARRCQTRTERSRSWEYGSGRDGSRCGRVDPSEHRSRNPPSREGWHAGIRCGAGRDEWPGAETRWAEGCRHSFSGNGAAHRRCGRSVRPDRCCGVRPSRGFASRNRHCLIRRSTRCGEGRARTE